MKQSLFIARLRGYVRIQIRGKDCERLIRPMVEGGFSIWDIQADQEGKLELCILIKDFFRLRPFFRQGVKQLFHPVVIVGSLRPHVLVAHLEGLKANLHFWVGFLKV